MSYSLEKAVKELDQMLLDQVVDSYAIGGAMTADWTEIKAKKRAARRILAALPLRIKMQKLDAMRERQDQLRRFKPCEPQEHH